MVKRRYLVTRWGQRLHGLIWNGSPDVDHRTPGYVTVPRWVFLALRWAMDNGDKFSKTR